MNYPSQSHYGKEWLVNGDIWTIKFVNKLKDRNGETLDGLCCPSEKVVRIRTGQTKKEMLRTFFHEFCHAIEFSYDMETDIKKKYTYDDFHDFIGILEGHLADFIRDNWMSYQCLLLGIKLVEVDEIFEA